LFVNVIREVAALYGDKTCQKAEFPAAKSNDAEALVKEMPTWAAIATPKASVWWRTESESSSRSQSRPEFAKDQTRRQHEQGVFESKGESGKQSVVKRGATLGRHISSKLGVEVSADRSAEVKVGSRAEGKKTTSEGKRQGSLALSYRPVFPRLRSGSHSKQRPL
jgi:hypothetical protein